MDSIALPEVKPADVTIPGQYVCYPADTKLYDSMTEMGMDTKTLKPSGMWIVEVLFGRRTVVNFCVTRVPAPGRSIS